jgi:hypothetical protein
MSLSLGHCACVTMTLPSQLSATAWLCRASVSGRLIPNRVHHVTCSSWTITSLAIPQTDEFDLFRFKAERRRQHPSVAALVGVFSLSERAKFVWCDVENGGRLHGKISGAPIAVGGRKVRTGRLRPHSSGDIVHPEAGRWMTCWTFLFCAGRNGRGPRGGDLARVL